MTTLASSARHRRAREQAANAVDLTTLSDAELETLAQAYPRDFVYPLSVVNKYPNAIFAERQRRRHVSVRAGFAPRAATERTTTHGGVE